MTVGKALGTVLISAFGGIFVGAALGLLLAILLPNYYPSVFGGPVDPIQTGLGLGASQGFLGGGLVGLVVCVILVWREIRLRDIEAHQSQDYPRPKA